jgi:hypothetical protein
MPDRTSSAYLSSRALGSRRELFHAVTLNAVGWAALAGICAVGAGIGLAAARFTGASASIIAPTGAAVAFAAVLAADRWKAARVPTTTWTDDDLDTGWNG